MLLDLVQSYRGEMGYNKIKRDDLQENNDIRSMLRESRHFS